MGQGGFQADAHEGMARKMGREGLFESDGP